MIETISIERFKNIASITLSLENINILVGANNSGKSSILQSIQFAVAIAQTTSLEEFRNTRWSQNKLSTSLTPNQIIYTPLQDVYSLGYGGVLKESKINGISVKFRELGTHQTANFLLRKGRNKNLAAEIDGQVLGDQIRNLENPYSIFVPGLAGIPAYEEFKSEGIVRRSAAKGDSNNVFRNILWLLKQNPSKWSKFQSDLTDTFPGLLLEISFDKLKDEHINAYINDGLKKLPIDAYGTGVLQCIQILSYVHLYNPKILILDEPDSHLHPSNQRKIADKLYELTNELQFQLVLSTHSRHLLDAFKDYARVNWITNGKINDRQYDFISVLLEIGALDRGDVLNNGATKCIVFTEDSDTKPLKTLLSANGFNLSETDIWSYNTCSRIDIAIELAAFIHSKAPGTAIIIHRDSDYLTDEEKQAIKDEATNAGIKIFFTLGTDIESYFLNPNHIQKIYTELTTEEIGNLIDDSTAAKKENSIAKFINARTNAAQKAHREGRSSYNAGRISIECYAHYDKNIVRYRLGKKVFKNLINKLQTNYGQKDLLVPTEDLKDQTLVSFKDTIWPS